MTNKLILIIEDDEKHILDARSELFGCAYYARNGGPSYTLLEAIKKNNDMGLPVNIYAKTYREASPWFGNVDGVISDIYFPLDSREPFNQPEPIGVRVAYELEKLNKPFVLNTAGYHHGAKYQWIFEMANQNNWPIIEAGSSSGEGVTKKWEDAHTKLISLIDENKRG